MEIVPQFVQLGLILILQTQGGPVFRDGVPVARIGATWIVTDHREAP